MTNPNPIVTAAGTLWASIVRTFIPIIVGAVLSFFVSRGIELDPEFKPALELLLSALFAFVWYVAVRLLETYVTPKLGWLLGLAKSPDAYSPVSPAKHAKDGVYDVTTLPPPPPSGPSGPPPQL